MKEFKLDNQPKITPGFKIPEGYFDQLSEQVMQKITGSEPKVIPISGRKSWLFAAAAVLVLSLTIPLLNKITSAQTQPDQTAVENYLAYHGEITDDQIVDLLDKEDIDKIKIDYQLNDTEIEDALPSGAELENYIIN